MARNCGCGNATCGCSIIAGEGVVVSGFGTARDPYVVSAELASLAQVISFQDTTSVDFTVLGAGLIGDPFIVSAVVKASPLPAYTFAGRPSAAALPAGSFYYDTTFELPKYSDGNVWQNGAPIPFVLSKGGTLSAGGGTFRVYNDSGDALTIGAVRAAVGGAPAGGSLVLDVKVNGVSIYATTPANRPSIGAGSQTALGGTPDTVTIPAGAYLTVDVISVPSTPGSDLTVAVWTR